MIKTYDDFVGRLNDKIKSDDEFYFELICTVVSNPNRYTGIFRLSNAKTKLVQNVTQSREIKFGDFMEEIVTVYIKEMGYENLSKDIGNDGEGNALSADQIFMRGDIVYLIEQKIRDDHDSTKKRGQYQNFRRKYSLLKGKHHPCTINASMWFIDDSFVKNKNYYLEQAEAECTPGVNINIYYGASLFTDLFERKDVWDEICLYLRRNKLERSDEGLLIPDFDTSEEIRTALRRLRAEKSTLYNKLLSDRPEYVQLRRELFPTGENLRDI